MGTTFGDKLDYLKTVHQVTDGEIGAWVNAVPSLVCRWRNGERRLDRARDASTVARLASFFIDRAVVTRQEPRLARLIDVDPADIAAHHPRGLAALTDFLFDPTPPTPSEAAPAPTPPSVIGVHGVLTALDALGARLGSRPAGLSIYLSLEHSRLFQDDEAARIWQALGRLNQGSPVTVVFDGWSDQAQSVSDNLGALLGYLQAGQIELRVIPGAQRCFYHNITFLAPGVGLVLTTEPAGRGAYVSWLADSPDLVAQLGTVFAGFDKRSQPLARLVGGTHQQAQASARLFEPGQDLQVWSSGVNLIYLDQAAYRRLLDRNGVTGSQRGYRLAKFDQDKQRFEAFLAGHRVREIVGLGALDALIAGQDLQTSDFDFHPGPVRGDPQVATSVLRGLIAYAERYPSLELRLDRAGAQASQVTGRIKGDEFLLVHTQVGPHTQVIWSDNWLLVTEHLRAFRRAWQQAELISTPPGVRAALELRLDRLENR